MLSGNNRAAIGARITVYAKIDGINEAVQVRDIQAGGCGGMTGGNIWANFGLGTATRVDGTVVQWPDGVKETFKKLTIDIYNTVQEGTSNPLPPPASWNFTSNTGKNAILGIPSSINPRIGNQSLRTGDAVGVFFLRNDSLICAGYSLWQTGQTCP